MPRLPGFIGPAYASQAQFLAGERTINLYSERLERPVGKSDAVLLSIPGLTTFATPTAGEGRGLFGENGRLFGVFGAVLYEFDSAGTPTNRGAVALDTNPASLAMNGNDELFAISGDTGYILDLGTNTLTSVVSAVTMGGQIDGFFAALDATTGTLKISESLDGLTWDASQIAQRTAASDPWIAMTIARHEVFLFGEKTGEPWYNAGNAPFPFAQRSSVLFDVGIEAPWSLTPFAGSIAWLGRRANGGVSVYWLNGYSPIRISTMAIDWALAQAQKDYGITDAIGWSYAQLGHEFYVLVLPAAEQTWVYDVLTNEWHERARWDATTGAFVAYRPRFAANMFGKTLVCDGESNAVYELDFENYTDVAAGVLRRVRRTPHLSSENRRIIVDSIEVECDRGVGTTSGQGLDPQLTLRTSRDGGKTWGAERTAKLGKIGEYRSRVRWTRCGSARDAVFEFACSDPVPLRLIDCYIRPRVCAG